MSDREQTFTNDISGVANVREQYENSPFKAWIKPISIEDTIPYEEYAQKGDFIPIADIVLDTETFALGEKQGTKKRNTHIQFLPLISKDEIQKKNEWLYLLVVEGRIVKIGGTRTGIKGRMASYLCGHHIRERGKSGDCSKTNGFIYNTFMFYLELGCKIQMYGFELPKRPIEVSILGKTEEIVVQTYHVYESRYMEDYKKRYNRYPILCDNCDPEYKNGT